MSSFDEQVQIELPGEHPVLEATGYYRDHGKIFRANHAFVRCSWDGEQDTFTVTFFGPRLTNSGQPYRTGENCSAPVTVAPDLYATHHDLIWKTVVSKYRRQQEYWTGLADKAEAQLVVTA